MKHYRKHYVISKEILIVCIISILGALLRFYKLGSKSLWFDELHGFHLGTYASTIFDVPQLLTQYYISDPPLFHIIQFFFLSWKENEFWARFVPCLIGILSIPILYLLVKNLLNKATAIVASFCLAISPYHIYYSQESRPYTLFLFFSILSFYYLFSAMKKVDSRIEWGLYTLFTFLCLMTSYISFFMIVCQCGIVVCFLLTHKVPFYSICKRFFCSLVVLSIFFLAWYPSMSAQKELVTSYININSPPLSLNTFIKTIKDIGSLNKYTFPFLFIVLWGVILDLRNATKRKYYLLFLWWIIFPIMFQYICLTYYFKNPFNTRFVIYILPVWLSVASSALLSVMNTVSCYLKGIFFKICYIIIFMAVVIPNYPSLSEYYYKDKRAWKEVVPFLKQKTSNQDVIVAEPGYFLPSILYYLDVKDYLDHNKAVRIDKSRQIHLGQLSSIGNLESLISRRGMWCITDPGYASECSSRGFRLMKEFKGILSSVLIYANDVVFRRTL